MAQSCLDFRPTLLRCRTLSVAAIQWRVTIGSLCDTNDRVVSWAAMIASSSMSPVLSLLLYMACDDSDGYSVFCDQLSFNQLRWLATPGVSVTRHGPLRRTRHEAVGRRKHWPLRRRKHQPFKRRRHGTNRIRHGKTGRRRHGECGEGGRHDWCFVGLRNIAAFMVLSGSESLSRRIIMCELPTNDLVSIVEGSISVRNMWKHTLAEDRLDKGMICWDTFSSRVKTIHKDRLGAPEMRKGGCGVSKE
ncbi:hypothetical protein Tco_1166754 [Tanacetum coccineum]